MNASNTRTLIVEDDPLVGEMIRGLLEEMGYIVTGMAADGHQAIEMTQSIRPDVVLMDIGLPDIDGIETMRRIHESCPTPVVILTAYDTPELVERASVAGAGAYLVKPPDAREVERAITLTMARFDDMMALRCMNAALQAEIAERMRAEKALQASETKYRELVQNANSIILRLDTQGRITFFNEFAQSFFGYAEDEILGRNAVGTIVPERETSGRDLMAMIKDIAQRPEQYINNENENIRRNGERVWIAWTNKAILDDEGGVTGILCIGNDITKRKQAEEALRKSEALFHSLIESLPQNVFSKDLEGRFTFANQRYCTTEGKSLADIIGKTDFDLHPPELAKKYLEDDRQVIETEQLFETVEEHQPIGGEKFYVQVIKTPVYDSRGHVSGILGIFWDITKRKRVEEQIKASLQEKELLLKEIHHRVKNNLQVVSSLLNLQANYVEDEQVIEMFWESRNRIRSMALVHEKLYRSPDLARVDFTEYIRNLAAQLFHSYRVRGREITLKIEVADAAMGIDTAIPCGLIVNELLSNALKHAFPPERDRPDGQEGEIRVGLSSDQAKFTLTVGDNGVGFPSDLDFRNMESLGLQLVTTLVEQLDGSIELDRSNGTTFKIEFTEQK